MLVLRHTRIGCSNGTPYLISVGVCVCVFACIRVCKWVRCIAHRQWIGCICTRSVDRVYLHMLSCSGVFAHAQCSGVFAHAQLFGCICTRSVIRVYLHMLSILGVFASAQ